MPGLLPILFLGVILGMRHATDADHVVAVTTIGTRQRSVADAMRIGALWGVGHTLTILLVGGAIIILGVVIPPRLGLAMEFAVAVMLIGLGAYNPLGRRGARARRVRRHRAPRAHHDPRTTLGTRLPPALRTGDDRGDDGSHRRGRRADGAHRPPIRQIQPFAAACLRYPERR